MLRENPTLDFSKEILSDIQCYNEYIILKLRTLDDISISYIKDKFGNEIFRKFKDNLNLLMERNYFVVENDKVIQKESNLMIADYLSKDLMI